MGAIKSYFKTIREEYGYRAAWLPGERVEAGDVGTLEKGRYQYRSNLKELGITFETDNSAFPLDYHFTTRGGVEIYKKSAAGLPLLKESQLGEAEAGFTVKFTRANSILLELDDARTIRIKDTLALGKTIERLYGEGKWEKDWVVVSETIAAKSGTIIVSKENGLVLDFKLNTSADINEIELADANLDLISSISKDQAVITHGKRGLTPFFQLMGIRTGWFNTNGSFTSREFGGQKPLDSKMVEGFALLKLSDKELNQIPED